MFSRVYEAGEESGMCIILALRRGCWCNFEEDAPVIANVWVLQEGG